MNKKTKKHSEKIQELYPCIISIDRTERFTMLELLIVIAIIMILASLLLPALGKVKEKGKQITCLSNLKQLVVVQLSYAQDFNGWDTTRWDEPGYGTWCPILFRNGYLSQASVLGCPSDPGRCLSGTYRLGGGRYGMNNMKNDLQSVQIFLVKNPSEHIEHTDSISLSSNKGWYAVNNIVDSNNFHIYMRHNNANVSFIDGHGENCTATRLNNLGWARYIDKYGISH